MIKVRHSAVIHRPVSDVFQFVSDVSQFKRWVTGAVRNKITSPEPFGVGSTFDQEGEFMNKRLEFKDIEVIHYAVDERFAYKCPSGPMPFEMHYFFSPAEEEESATKVTVVVVGENKGFLKMMGSVASAYYKFQLESDLKKLEEILTENT